MTRVPCVCGHAAMDHFDGHCNTSATTCDCVGYLPRGVVGRNQCACSHHSSLHTHGPCEAEDCPCQRYTRPRSAEEVQDAPPNIRSADRILRATLTSSQWRRLAALEKALEHLAPTRTELGRVLTGYGLASLDADDVEAAILNARGAGGDK